jgi:hypothetical protein
VSDLGQLLPVQNDALKALDDAHEVRSFHALAPVSLGHRHADLPPDSRLRRAGRRQTPTQPHRVATAVGLEPMGPCRPTCTCSRGNSRHRTTVQSDRIPCVSRFCHSSGYRQRQRTVGAVPRFPVRATRLAGWPFAIVASESCRHWRHDRQNQNTAATCQITAHRRAPRWHT